MDKYKFKHPVKIGTHSSCMAWWTKEPVVGEWVNIKTQYGEELRVYVDEIVPGLIVKVSQ